MGFLNSLEAMEAADQIPVNLIFTIEGEEESGSSSLAAFYSENREQLCADVAFEPFWANYGTDVHRPILLLVTKGIVCLELVCRGGDWGGPIHHAVHSSVAGWIASPVWRLIKAIETLVDTQGKSLVEGLDGKEEISV